MKNYQEQLEKMGITASRTEDLAVAMNNLVSAICKLDLRNLKTFCTKFGLIGHMDLFCRVEDTRNIAKEMYDINIKRAEGMLDGVEFDLLSERLFHLAEEAAEIHIPGAHQLCRSLMDMRKHYEVKPVNLFMHVARTLKFNITQYRLAEEDLCLNSDRCIGSVTQLLSREPENQDGHGESGHAYYYVYVESNSYVETIKKALKHTYKSERCNHEHDCCGCVFQSVYHVKHLAHNVYCMHAHWYRNV
jgi:hypothetical protein